MKKQNITKELKQRVLLLDGALGTMFQQHNLSEQEFRGEEFASWDVELKGCNDILSLTRPNIVEQLAHEYLEAGADIITTNTFNANAISLKDYHLEDYAYKISKASAEILRRAADQYNPPRYVAGSLGPTNRTASLSADVMNPAAREVTFDELVEAYSTQVEGLLDGGADVIILETIFDTLNAKAALYAIDKIAECRAIEIPIMASGTLTDASGRTLSGQTIEGFYTSIKHAKLLSIGFNCAFGARQMMPYLEELSQMSTLYTSAHPNAGLPNIMGGYDETPEMFAKDVEQYLQKGLVNIIGGCCGTTPQHIKLLSEIIKKYPPRKVTTSEPVTTLSGLEMLKVSHESNFINIGERGNVAGSAKFARLIREGAYDEALSVIRAQVDSGAQIIDICMDDGMIEGVQAMHHFLCLMASEPEISRVPVMIDSSNWEVLMAGLKVSQGKSIVNSISLKEGEQIFIDKAKEIHRMGAAAVVMLFDEAGQADTYERKIEIAQRAYTILTSVGFPAEDIIFDPNVLSVSTGIEEHDSYGKAFIDAVRWIKQNLPHAKVSGGVSNLSFAFRGNNVVREAMHSVFLYHAIEAGMDMAIVNAGMLQVYDNIEPTLLQRVEDVILCRRTDASERLLEIAQELKGTASTKDETKVDEWRTGSLTDRVQHAMTKGVVEYIEADTLEGYANLQSPMRVIDELLMPAMEHVGKLFGEGKMFLPQVVKTARVMKRAVEVLTPYITEQKREGAGRVVIATVKGDVHDIGKNIVAVVMSCNGYMVEDLGVMVDTLRIVDSAVEMGADAICLSGLITPSLEEMTRVVKECQKRGLSIPVILGGATTSKIHTAVKIAPHYEGVVIHANNASDNPKMLNELLSTRREEYIAQIKSQQEQLRQEYDRTVAKQQLLPLDELRRSRVCISNKDIIKPQHTGNLVFSEFDITDVERYINWNFFFAAWGMKGHYPEILESERYGEEARKLFADAANLLREIKVQKKLTLEGVLSILPARSESDDIIVTTRKGKEVTLPMLRSQSPTSHHRSMADFVAQANDHICCFAITAGVGLDKMMKEYREAGDEYNAMLSKLLADRLTEAFAERVHDFVAKEMWGFEGGVRMAFGYAACPDHSLKREVFELLNIKMTSRMTLSESYMITPAESICGVIFPRGEYFSVGMIDAQQAEDYAQRRGITTDELKRLIPTLVIAGLTRNP